MNKITNNSQNTMESNPCKRMLMLLQLYWPSLRKGFISCFLYPFLAYVLVLVLKKNMGIESNWLVEVPIVVLIYLAPLMLTRYDYRDISSQLPVSTGDKLCFLLLIFWFAVPLTIEISLWLSELICKVIFSTQISVDILNLNSIQNELGFSIPNFIGIFLITSSFLCVALYYVASTTRNEEGDLNLNIWAILCLLLVFLLSFGIIVSLISYIREDGPSSAETNKLILTAGIFLIYEIIGLIYLVKLYKYLRHSGF